MASYFKPDLLKRRVSDFLEHWPLLYNRVMRWRFRNRDAASWLVRPDYDLVIEGFPRCANSFALRAFRQAQGPDSRLRIASHIHSPAQVVLAARWGIPALVLIRPPEDAVVSLMAIAWQNRNLPEEAFLPRNLQPRIGYWTQRYARFYGQLQNCRDRFLLATFDEVTRDFGDVIGRLNMHFNTGFHRFDHVPEAVESIFRANDVHLSPSPERESFKERIRGAYADDGNAENRVRAERSYSQMNARADSRDFL